MRINKLLGFIGFIGFCSMVQAETVFKDEFNDGILDSSWDVKYERANDWNYHENSELNVTNISPTILNSGSSDNWSIVTISQGIHNLTNFNMHANLSWNNESSQRDMQFIEIFLLDDDDNYVVKTGYRDAWVGSRGGYSVEIGGTRITTIRNSFNYSGSGIVQVSRSNNNITVYWDDVEIASLTNESLIKKIGIQFGFYNFSNYTTSFFGSNSIDYLRLETLALAPAPEVYINTNSQNIFKDEMLQVFFNTSVPEGVSEKYDVYLSVTWDDVILYDNGRKLVSNREPLYKNITVPNLSSWLENPRLRYTFPKDLPQTDYILGLHLMDNKENVVFESFSSVSYFPEPQPFSSLGNNEQQAKIAPSNSRQAKSKTNQCHLGGILTDFENTEADELSQVTKRSMLALQMGSYFSLKGSRLEKMYNGVKGPYNLLKKGEVVCNNLNKFDKYFKKYDSYIQNDGLSKEQVSNLFAIEVLGLALSLPKGGVLYSGFDSNGLVNGIKDYLRRENKFLRDVADATNEALIILKFEQPYRWEDWKRLFSKTSVVKLDVTITPVFTYAGGYTGELLKDIPKILTDSESIKTASKSIGETNSDSSTLRVPDLTRGLYLIKASTKNGEEVFRDTIHVTHEAQKHTMLINR